MEQKKAGVVTRWAVVSLALELGFIIALPIVILGLTGKYLDTRLATGAVFKIVGMLLAITVTSLWISRRFAEIFRSMTQKSQDDQNKQHQINQIQKDEEKPL
ncbi:MAG: hypothetical protein A2445_02385 [Candidatus Jacksonbacteria bacterium RIFOXYC2_FULL_44_29]|nr:MAG: hypothetical protein UW45_C0020G0003 [Parcubacteria group bacterium GW2011_GWC2_44_22]OGY74468.1 MAG: hypothetical protein A2240_02645 [Candidatus Jacksonbacteria bacterium RIFOXYA2_FULL_43_12]OGY77376.1 MAG: hypothetical protein A2295_01595 [Candidatus Jacksonbacteria bacterium RIFOXYB2_FULL_44_15]OGY78148.1 MAG: hypothetical protein A2550_05940 [Candidatus Jacksonbacteria bacterium RIFOXYD2_FULL_43_21]OGY80724.1 MAG: hypothetical protein A2445_02385 [Candidatus Jacksonbacteria bacteri